MMKDDNFKLLRGFDNRQTEERTNRRTDICDCRVAFATENYLDGDVDNGGGSGEGEVGDEGI